MPHGCPPGDATRMSGTFYRLASADLQVGDSTKRNDWKLPHENTKGACAGRAEACECHALSLIHALEDIEEAKKASRWVRRKSVAQVEIDESMGVLRTEPTEDFTSHFDWWPIDPDNPPDAWIVMEGGA